MENYENNPTPLPANNVQAQQNGTKSDLAHFKLENPQNNYGLVWKAYFLLLKTNFKKSFQLGPK